MGEAACGAGNSKYRDVGVDVVGLGGVCAIEMSLEVQMNEKLVMA